MAVSVDVAAIHESMQGDWATLEPQGILCDWIVVMSHLLIQYLDIQTCSDGVIYKWHLRQPHFSTLQPHQSKCKACVNDLFPFVFAVTVMIFWQCVMWED